jgi:uncharacterized membrane protein YqjE
MLFDSLKGIGRAFFEILINRIETLTLDLKEDRYRFVSLLLLGASAFFVLMLGIILGVFFLVLTFWASNRLLAIGILMSLFLGLGISLFALLVRKMKTLPGPFEGILSEFYKDREALGGRRRGDKR